MSELFDKLTDLKKDLASLDHQIEGAAYMIDNESPHHNFMKYLQRSLCRIHDQIGFQIKTLPKCDE